MKKIQLTRGLYTVVDEEDYDRLINRTWYASKSGNTFVARSDSPTRILMHRLILNAENGIEVDHIDGNSLNNLRSNLRLCSHRLNICNQRTQLYKSSMYKGVSWSKVAKRWHAYIKCSGVRSHLGYFDTQEEAAKAYNNAAITLFGEFAKINQL